jgi:hypothetical protein
MIFGLQSKGEKVLKLSAWVKVYFDRITNALICLNYRFNSIKVRKIANLKVS